MKFLEELKKQISDRKSLIRTQEQNNLKIRVEIEKLAHEIKEKENKYKDTLDGSITEEIEKDKEKIQKLNKQLEYQEVLLEEAKKQKIRIDIDNVLKETSKQAEDINLSQAIKNIEIAKQKYLSSIKESIHKAENINGLFEDIKACENSLELEQQEELSTRWRRALLINSPGEIDIIEVKNLERELYTKTLGYRPVFKEIERKKEQEEEEKRKRDLEEFETKTHINNRRYGYTKNNFY